MNHGRCLCGRVRYEVDGDFIAVVNCHCSMCRKHHGSPFVTWAVVPAATYRLTAGDEAIVRYASSTGFHRSFCATCGSVTPEVTPSGDAVVLPAGNLDGELPAPQQHMFVASKAPWYTIADDLPQHAAWPPGFGTESVEREPREAPPGLRGGSCLCGAVAYTFDALPMRFMYCHCSRCRRARGAAHGSNLFVPVDGFQWTRGGDLVDEYKVPEAQRFGVAFCRRCGSAVPRPAPALGVVVVPAGSLDSDPGMPPQAHIFVDSRAPWDTVPPDGIPRFAELPPPR